MNFFIRQDRARRQTRWLVMAFAVAVGLIVVAIDLIVLIAISASKRVEDGPLFTLDSIGQHIGLLVFTSAVVLLVIIGASLFKMAKLGRGGSVVAQALGATRVGRDAADPKQRQLCNVVEEMAIASGVPVPAVYVLEEESAINAFAAGHSTSDAAVAVSQGCLDHLNRSELQGVVAHEFSHILNGDMRLNIRLMGVLFGILVIALAGYQVLRVTPRRSKQAGAMVMIGMGLVAAGYVGLFSGRLIQAAVSRQREFLADASAVQFTRDKGGIGGALKKIAASGPGSVLQVVEGEEVAHMLFANGLKRRWLGTHPPIMARIRTLDPSFSSRQLTAIAAQMALQSEPEQEAEVDKEKPSAPPVASQAVPLAGLVAAVGTLSWQHVGYAEHLLAAIPLALKQQAHGQNSAIDVVLALLLDSEGAARQQQLELIGQQMGQEHAARVADCVKFTDVLHPLHRLPLVELSLPILKQRPVAAIRVYLRVIQTLIHLDAEVTVFEFALAKLVSSYLVEALQSAPQANNRSLRSMQNEIADVFAILAHCGHEQEEDAKQAYLAGLSKVLPMHTIPWSMPGDWVTALDHALSSLDLLKPLFKQALLDGLIVTLSHDQQIQLAEVELLRAISAALHCPMPPVLGASQA